MNLYHDAMDHCAPDEGLRGRMERAVLPARPNRAKTFRPRGFRKKAAALLLAAWRLRALPAVVLLYVAVSCVRWLILRARGGRGISE